MKVDKKTGATGIIAIIMTILTALCTSGIV